MTEDNTSSSNEPEQTTPKGLAIPIPKRRDIIDALLKLANPKR